MRDWITFFRILVRPGNWPLYLHFLRERKQYLKLAEAAQVHLPPFAWSPRLRDRLQVTPIGNPYYFYQDTWGAAQVARVKPERIVDIGSSAKLVATISQFVPMIALDIRPLPARIPNLTVISGDIMHLPFPDNSVEFVMSLCVVEHIGLGRYGDHLDPQGINKAMVELRRVVRPGGRLVLSVPMGPPCLAFNAHRIFSYQEFLNLLSGFSVEEEVFCNPDYTREDPSHTKILGELSFYCTVLIKK